MRPALSCQPMARQRMRRRAMFGMMAAPLPPTADKTFDAAKVEPAEAANGPSICGRAARPSPIWCATTMAKVDAFRLGSSFLARRLRGRDPRGGGHIPFPRAGFIWRKRISASIPPIPEADGAMKIFDAGEVAPCVTGLTR